MPPRKTGLGRGLDALIGPPREAPGAPSEGAAPGAAAAAPAQRQPYEVEIGRIEPNPLQPRKHFDETELAELADSIREHGVIQPVVVTESNPTAGGRARYTLVAGQRRWQAAKIAGLTRIPIIVREAAGRDLLELALIENVQRADLNPLEEAAAYAQLQEEFGLTQEEIGQRVGKSRFAVNNTIRLLKLPATVQHQILEGALSEGHARAILGVADPEVQRVVAAKVVADALTVRQTEELVRRLGRQQRDRDASGDAKPEGRSPRDRSLDDAEEEFRKLLGTKVTLTRSRRGGRLTIHFYNDEQLTDLYDRLARE